MRLKLQLPAKAGRFHIFECEAVRLVTLPDEEFQDFLNGPHQDGRWAAEPFYADEHGRRIYQGVLVLGEGHKDGVFAYDGGKHFAYLPGARAVVDSILEQAVEKIIREGAENTNEGSWCYYFSELYEQMGLVIEDGNGFDTMLLEKLEQRPEAADVTLTDECFDVCYYLDCCKNLAPEQPAPSLSAERKEEIISGILNYMAEYFDDSSLYDILHNTLDKFINHLDGKQIEPESFASAEIGGLRPLEKGDILCIDGPFPTDRELKFRLDLSSYGVQKEVLNLMTDCSKPENSLEITCSYDAARQGISNKLDLTLRQKNGMVRHDFFYPLMEEERAHLLKIVEQFCQQQAGKTLNDYYAQLDMERENPPELTAGVKRLPIDTVSFSGEITECDGKLNFYIPINFDPDEVFGTNVASAFNDDWLNVYANFDWKTGRIDSALTVCLVCSDGHEFEFSYPLTPAEQVQLWDQMDAYCRQQSGQTLGETRTSLLREQAEEGLEIRL